MARKRAVKSVAIALTVAFVLSALVVLISPTTKAALWTQTSDTDFGNNNAINGLDIIGSGNAAYLQLKKDFNNWFFKNPATKPPARQAMGSFFDTLNGRTFIFGGLDATSNYLNDTWVYTAGTTTWTMLQANAPPEGRWAPGMAFDSIHGIAVLYGGWATAGQNFETWEYDVNTATWTNRTGGAGASPQLSSNPLAFDSGSGKIIASGQGRIAWETWAYDVTTHVWTQRIGSTPPGNRSGHQLAYYPQISKTVLFGGSYLLNTYDETWEYDYGTDKWTDKTGQTGGANPSARSGYGFAYRSTMGDLILWGGNPGFPTDTWHYFDSGGSRFWSMIPTGGAPTGRFDLSMTYDVVANATIVFAGRDPVGNRLNDTWSYEGGFRTFGFTKSQVFDSLHANTMWNSIWWNQTPGNVPAGGSIRFQVGTSNNPDPNDASWTFTGPAGTTSDYYVTPGTAIYALSSPKRYAMYIAQLICSACTDSPHLEDVSIDYSASSIAPYVVSTYPFGQIGVPIGSQIWLNFSEPMDTAQVTVTLKDAGTWTDFPFTPTWFNTSTTLVMSHSSTPFVWCTQYRYNITLANDQEGQSMAGLPKSYVFSTFCPEPEILSAYPHLADTDIPLSSPIYVNFSKSMATVDVNMTPPLPDSTYEWSNGNKNLKVTHVGTLQDCTVYDVNVTGQDVNSKNLVPGAVPNPWSFESRCLNPRVISTDPYDQQIDIGLNRPVVITFSHKMKTSTVNVAFSPTITLTPSWNTPTNTTLTLSHPPAFVACTKYTANVTGNDTAGNHIQGDYYAFWFFTSCGGAPFVVNTQPADKTIDVPVDQNVMITFNESMIPGSVTKTVFPNDWTWTDEWGLMNMALTLNHTTPFSTCTKYYINVTGGRDADENKALVNGPVPNRFTFDTVCTNPSVKSVVPLDGAIDVPTNTNIAVTFNKPMATTTFIYTLTPDPGLLPSWTGGDTVFHLNHGPLFAEGTLYTLRIGFAEDKLGNQLIGDREFNFTTIITGADPFIVYHEPLDKETGVLLDKVIYVVFSEPMQRSSLSVVITPYIALAPTWTGNDKYLNLSHAPFPEATPYNVTISATDLSGNPLVGGPVPNPWEFTTTSTNPKITLTDPQHLETGVPLTKAIVVDFNKPMNRSSVNEIVTPSGIAFSHTWSNGDQRLTLSHGALFLPCQLYNAQITGEDTLGNPLIPGTVPNPWQFTTTCLPGAPGGLQVHRQGADIHLMWNPATLATGYHVYSSNDRFASWPWTLSGNVTATEYTASGDNSDTSDHFYIVRGYNNLWLEGANSTMGVRAYKSFTVSASATSQWFSLPYHSMYKKASDITTELTSTNINVVAKWDPAKQTSILYYYLRNKWRGNDFTISPGDGLWLGVVNAFSWSINGTDASVMLSFTLNPAPKGNFNFISLPYTNAYSNAKAISDELTSSSITEVGRYNLVTHAFEKWTFVSGTWQGTNFAIMPGDGIYLVISATFNWNPKLITPEVP